MSSGKIEKRKKPGKSPIPPPKRKPLDKDFKPLHGIDCLRLKLEYQ